MANRFPLVFDAQQSKQIKELPNGDNLNLAGSSIVDAVNINASGVITADSLTVNSLNVAGVGGTIAAVAISNDYNDLNNLPILFSGSYNDLTDVPIGTDWNNVTNKPTIPSKLSELINDVGFANEESLNIRADQLIGLAPVATSNSFTDLADASELVTQSQLVGDTLTVEVTNTGDLVGSVFGADSTLLVDHINNRIYADIATSSLIGSDSELLITTPNQFPIENIAIRVAQVGNVFIEGDEIRLTGKVTANRLYGTFTGFVYSNDSTLVVNPDTGDLNGKLNGEVDGDINKTNGGQLRIENTGFGGILVTPGGDFDMPVSENIQMRANNDALISATNNLILQSTSGTIEFNGSAIDASLTTANFANAEVNFTSATLNFLNSTVNNLSADITGTLTGDVITNSITSTSGNITLESDNYVIIDSANAGQIEIGRASGAGNVIIGNKSNSTNVSINGDVIMDTGTSITGNIIGNHTGDVFAGNGTSVVLNSGSDGTDATFTGNVTGDLIGNVTGNVTGNVGNFSLAASIIDTDDSSAITITPAVVMNSDVTVENDLIVSNKASIGSIMQLGILSSEPTNPVNGMVAIADGTSWDPTNTAVQTMVVYLGGDWRQLAQGSV